MVECIDTPFTSAYSTGDTFEMPVAHGEGCYVAPRDELLRIEQEQRVVFRYLGDNPNGSEHAIAGITNSARNVVGMMPHPERAADPLLGEERGAIVFESFMKIVEVSQGASQ